MSINKELFNESEYNFKIKLKDLARNEFRKLRYICYYDKDKIIYSYYDYGDGSADILGINILMLKAIQKQIEELGWIE